MVDIRLVYVTIHKNRELAREMSEIRGQKALVVGGGKGIGGGIAVLCAEGGAQVFAADFDRGALDWIAEVDGDLVPVIADLRDVGAGPKLAATLPDQSIDMICITAGSIPITPMPT